MRTSITTHTSIKASPAQVFAYLSNLKLHYLWNPQIVSISSHRQLKLGSKYMTESRLLGLTITATNSVTKFNPPTEIMIENTTGSVQYQVHFVLEPLGDETDVNLSISLTTNIPALLVSGSILRRFARHEIKSDLYSLKIAVESHLE